MGDISAEPSMEDILSSIKRIIAEEGETATAAHRARRAQRIMTPRSEPGDFGHDEILELSDPVRIPDEEAPIAMGRHAPIEPEPAAEAPAPFARPDSPLVEPILKPRRTVDLSQPSRKVDPVMPAPAADPAPPPAIESSPAPAAAADPILSSRAADASRGSLDALSRLVVKPEIAGSDSLEGLVREMLRPMLREWLDAHLPAMVETMVSREIARITGSR